METSMKEKNMPTIPSNLYGGLQKWVTRASKSIEWKKSRRNSDVSHHPTMNKSSVPENQGYQDNKQHGFVPVHVRSRSVPVEMLEPESNLTFLERNYCRKASLGPILTERRNSYQKEGLLEPWKRQESSRDDTRTAVRPKALSRGFSKSESSLLEASLNSPHSIRSKSQITPPKYRVRRTSSQTTEESLESYTSDLDINCNIDKKTNNSQALKKANKTDGALKFSDNLRKSSSTNKLAKDIKYRLDKWVEKTTGFHDSRQSSFESTSSSDEPSDTLVFRKQNKSSTSYETRELRELQNALEDLVSSCGRNSQKNSEQEQKRSTVPTTTVQAIRKVSLKDAGPMFSKEVSSESLCSQSVLQNQYRSKQCGSSSGSTGSGGSITDEMTEENNNKTNSQLEVSFNSVHGKRVEKEGVRDEEESYDLNILNYDIDIGSGSIDTLPLSTSMEILESDLSNQNNSVSPPKSQNKDENELQQENPQIQNYDQEDNCFSSNETKQTETNEQVAKEKPASEMDDKVDNHTKTPVKSTKSYRAPPPPSGASKESRQNQDKKNSDGTFNDVDLDAFAKECLRQAAEKKKKKTKERETKSDSEEEKRSLKGSFIYIKNEATIEQSINKNPGQPKKTSTPPRTSFDKNFLYYNTFSDNECERNAPPSRSKIREKRSSVDSQDSRNLSNLLPQFEDIKNAQSAEEDCSSDSFQNEEDLTTENPGTGMRKFPSLPLFYVPKDFDQSMEFKHNKSSLRKSLWKRIKSLPQKSENRVNQNLKSKKKDTSPQQFLDPFYHGDKEDDDLTPAMRTKAWTLSTTKINRPVVSKRRPSLETRRSAPLIKVANNVEQNQEPDRLLNDYVVIPRKDEESQC